MLEMKTGEWYFFMTCRKCTKRIAIWDDPSRGKAVVQADPAATIEITCPHCGKHAKYPASELKSGEATSLQ
jgi:RNase P subunit RPR2